MPALGGATACQTALVLTFKILLFCANKILLTQVFFSGTLPTNSPQISEANATMCFLKWILGRAAVQCTDPHLTSEWWTREQQNCLSGARAQGWHSNRGPDPSLISATDSCLYHKCRDTQEPHSKHSKGTVMNFLFEFLFFKLCWFTIWQVGCKKNMFESSFYKIFGNYFLNNVVFRVKSFIVLNVHVSSFFFFIYETLC